MAPQRGNIYTFLAVLFKYIHRCAVPCSAARNLFDHFEIYTNSNLKIIERTTCCAVRCCAAVNLNLIEWTVRNRSRMRRQRKKIVLDL
jgi:hypothetical protein